MVPSLEIRINSVQDAKALVSDLAALHTRIQLTGADSVEFKIAEECVRDVQRILAGVVRIKAYTSVIKCADGRILFAPAPYCEDCAFGVKAGAA